MKASQIGSMGGRARKRPSLNQLVPLGRRAPWVGGPHMGGGGAQTLIGPLPPPLYLCAWACGKPEESSGT